MQQTDERSPGGIFSKRFWTEPRPRTGASRAELLRRLWTGFWELVILLAFTFSANEALMLLFGGKSLLFR